MHSPVEEQTPPFSVATFHRPLLLPVWHHATIKAGISLAADEIFGEPTIGQTSEIVGVPFEPLYVPLATKAKIGTEWLAMNVTVPSNQPVGVFDTLPRGTAITLLGGRKGDRLFIKRTEDELPTYSATLANKKYALRAELQENPPTLTEDDVVSIIRGALGYVGNGQAVDSPWGARQLLRDLVRAYPKNERVHQDLRQHTWESAGISIRALLARTHGEKLGWKHPREKYTFKSSVTMPLTLPGHGVMNHNCTAEEVLTYSFAKLYSRNEHDIEADLDITFKSGQALTELAQSQYTSLVHETGPAKQDFATQHITRALAQIVLGYRDEQRLPA